MLVSLAWPNHVHHHAATTWFDGLGSTPWATTAFTEVGFVRVSSNSAAIPGAVTPGEALLLLDRIRLHPGHQFIVDDVQAVFAAHLDGSRLLSHRQVTDAHLLAVARAAGGRLATFDPGVASLAGGEDVEVVPVGPSLR